MEKDKKRSVYVNGNRTKEQRKVRYCFLRHIGFSRDLSRVISAYRDKNYVRAIIQIGDILHGKR